MPGACQGGGMTQVDLSRSGPTRALTFVPAIAMVVTLLGVLVGNGVILNDGSVGEGRVAVSVARDVVVE